MLLCLFLRVISVVNPLPHMPILGSSNSAANKDNYACQKYQLTGYSYLIEEKTLWKKEKLLITSNFSFSDNISKNWLLLMRQNDYEDLWSEGLTDGPHRLFMGWK